jgi:dienelactone hydrolase
MRRALAAAILLFLSLATGLSAEGSRPIGFRVLDRVDASRATKERPEGRPLQISIWYPAKPGAAPSALTFSDYVVLSATETSLGAPSSASAAKTLEGYRGFLARAGVTPAEADAWLATKMRAVRDAPPTRDHPPLVLIAQGNGDSAADQAFLAESLAARGFVVATIPSQANLDGPMRSEADVTAHVESQTADLDYALRTMIAEKSVRPDGFGAVGHSFGARSALLLAMREGRVTTVVSLDGGIGSKTGRRELEAARGFDRSRPRARLLHLYETGDPAMDVDLDLVRSLPGEKWIGRVDAMRHVHFSTAGVMAVRLPGVGRATSATAETSDAWSAVAEATGAFLEHGLRKDARTRWTPPVSPLIHWEETPDR